MDMLMELMEWMMMDGGVWSGRMEWMEWSGVDGVWSGVEWMDGVVWSG